MSTSTGNALQTQVIAGITVPSTPLIDKALQYAQAELSTEAYNHVVRSWLTGSAILSHLPSSMRDTLDIEAYAIATILHDMGWSSNKAIISTDKRFEVDGANDARKFLEREGDPKQWNRHRVQLVWDAIALHTTRSIAAYKEPEVAFASIGIYMELLGPENIKGLVPEHCYLTKEEFEGINKEYGRQGLRDSITEVLCGFCRDKPQTTYETFMQGYGEKYVQGYNVEGKRAVDLFENFLVE